MNHLCLNYLRNAFVGSQMKGKKIHFLTYRGSVELSGSWNMFHGPSHNPFHMQQEKENILERAFFVLALIYHCMINQILGH